MKTKIVGLMVPSLWLAMSCGPISPTDEMVINDSTLKTITAKRFECDVFDDRLPLVKEKYSKFIRGGSQKLKEQAYASLTRLPDDILELAIR